ncbi:MAG: hypothetical protein ACREMN_09155 [Gemmatimonadales bacterium]
MHEIPKHDDEAERVLYVCWNRRPGPLPGESLSEAVCADCVRAIECPRDIETVAEGLERRLGGAIPRVCISCAVTRFRATPSGVRVATIGAGRAVAKFQEVCGITEDQQRDARRRGKAPEN